MGDGSLSWPTSQFQNGTTGPNPAEGREGRAGIDWLRGAGRAERCREGSRPPQNLTLTLRAWSSQSPEDTVMWKLDTDHSGQAQPCLQLPTLVSPTPTTPSPVVKALCLSGHWLLIPRTLKALQSKARIPAPTTSSLPYQPGPQLTPPQTLSSCLGWRTNALH